MMLSNQSGVREMSITAEIIRADGRREPLGTVSYWHKNPLRRFAFAVTSRARRIIGRLSWLRS